MLTGWAAADADVLGEGKREEREGVRGEGEEQTVTSACEGERTRQLQQ